MTAFFGAAICCFVLPVMSQTQSFIRTYGIDGFNFGSRLAVLSDTTYMLMGNKSGTANSNNVYLIHVDKTGQIIRDRLFGNNDLVYARDMSRQGDTLFVIAGYTMNNSSQEYDIIVLWIDKALNLLLTKQHISGGWNLAGAVATNSSGDVFVAGETYLNGQHPALHLLHYNNLGQLMNESLYQIANTDIIVRSMICAEDTLLYIAGSLQNDTLQEQAYIFCFNTNFEFINSFIYSNDTLHVRYNDIAHIDHNKIAATGYHTLIGTTTKRFLFHQFTYGLQQTVDKRDYAPGSYGNCVAASPEGFSVAAGVSTVYGAGNEDFWYLRYNNDDFLSASTIGGLMYDEPFDVAFALDSSLVMIGTTSSFGNSITNIMFAKTCKNYFYCFDDYQHYTDIQPNENFKESIKIFPNPVNEMLNIQTQCLNNHALRKISVYSIDGKMILTESFAISKCNFMLDVSALNNGLYVLMAETNSGSYILKFIKM